MALYNDEPCLVDNIPKEWEPIDITKNVRVSNKMLLLCRSSFKASTESSYFPFIQKTEVVPGSGIQGKAF